MACIRDDDVFATGGKRGIVRMFRDKSGAGKNYERQIVQRAHFIQMSSAEREVFQIICHGVKGLGLTPVLRNGGPEVARHLADFANQPISDAGGTACGSAREEPGEALRASGEQLQREADDSKAGKDCTPARECDTACQRAEFFCCCTAPFLAYDRVNEDHAGYVFGELLLVAAHDEASERVPHE